MKDYYRVLGVPDNATEADIKSAYRRLAKRYHPDLNPGNRHSEEKFKEILDAYTILSDPSLRAQYDRRRNAPPPSDYFTKFYAEQEQGTGRKKERPKKEYSPEYMEAVRKKSRQRQNIVVSKRRKILKGMIVTFIVYLIGTGLFELWVEKQREEETKRINQRLSELVTQQEKETTKTEIQNLDSPYDSIFGAGITTWLSPNQIVFLESASDAVVCLVQKDKPGRTIRNEFIQAGKNFIMKEIPNGSYTIKVYTGEEWRSAKPTTEDKILGGFTKNEAYFRIDRNVIHLKKPTYEDPKTRTSDTVFLDPDIETFISIPKEEFFSSGE